MRGTGEIHLVGSTTLNADIPVVGIVMESVSATPEIYMSLFVMVQDGMH
jgi:hypothetical protein